MTTRSPERVSLATDLRQFTDEVLGKLLQLIALQPRERLGDGRAEGEPVRLVNAVQANRHHVRAPRGGGGTRARAPRDASTVKRHGHFELTLPARRVYRCRQVETWHFARILLFFYCLNS